MRSISARTARQIYDRWRGFQPWPGAYTTLRGKKLIVHRMRVGASVGLRRECCGWGGRRWRRVAGRARLVVFDEVQMEGKRRMSAAEFLRGYQVKSGERLGL